MKKKSLILKAAVAMLAFSVFIFTPNLKASTFAVQCSYSSTNWTIDKAQLTRLKKEAYEQSFNIMPSDEMLKDIFVQEDHMTKNLEFYMRGYILNGSSKIVPGFFVHFNTLFYSQDNIENSNLTWRFQHE